LTFAEQQTATAETKVAWPISRDPHTRMHMGNISKTDE